MRRTLSVAVALSFLGAVAVEAQPKPQKDALVVLKLPTSAFKTKEKRFLGTVMGEDLVATVEAAPSGVSVNGNADWITDGFPSLLELKVAKVKTNEKGESEVELKSLKSGLKVKVLFKTGLTTAFPQVFALPSEADTYRKQAYAALGSKFFTGPLAALPLEKKETLLVFAHMTARGTTMTSTTYKDNLYLAIDLGGDENVYNELRMNQAQRVARVMNDKLLAILKAFARPVEDVRDIYGLRLELDIPHKSFGETAATPTNDKLELYAPSELIKKFADADITSQQFLDGCVVIVNDNRISVPLAN